MKLSTRSTSEPTSETSSSYLRMNVPSTVARKYTTFATPYLRRVPVSVKYPRRGRGVAATRLRNICAANVRLPDVDASEETRPERSQHQETVALENRKEGGYRLKWAVAPEVRIAVVREVPEASD